MKVIDMKDTDLYKSIELENDLNKAYDDQEIVDFIMMGKSGALIANLRRYVSAGLMSVHLKDVMTSLALCLIDQGYLNTTHFDLIATNHFKLKGSVLDIYDKKIGLSSSSIGFYETLLQEADDGTSPFKWYVGEEERVIGSNYLEAVLLNIGISERYLKSWNATKYWTECFSRISPSRKDIEEAENRSDKYALYVMGSEDIRIVSPILKSQLKALAWDNDGITAIKPKSIINPLITLDVSLTEHTKSEDEFSLWFASFDPLEYELRGRAFEAEYLLWKLKQK